MALTTSLTIGGRLTKDPVLSYSRNGGKPFCRVSIAVNPRELDRASGEWKDGEPVYWDGTVFGDLAEHVGHSLRKGNRVIAIGSVKSESYEDKASGTTRTALKFQIEDIGPSLLYTNADVSERPARKSADTAPAEPAAIADGWNTYDDDETPF